MSVKQDLVEKRNELDAVNRKIKKINDESKTDNGDFDFMKSNDLPGEDAKSKLNEYRKMLAKSQDLGEQVDGLAEAVKGFEREFDEPRQPEPQAKGNKPETLGDMFIESAAYKAYREGKNTDIKSLRGDFDIGLKTVMTTSAGFAPESIRTGEIVGYASEMPTMFDAIPKAQTGSAAIVYMEQTTRTNSSAAKTESTGAYAESAIAYTEKTVTVRDIGTILPVTNEQIEDVMQLRDILNTELPMMLRQTLSDYSLNGSGSAPYPQGILQNSSIQTQAKSGDTTDTLFKAMTKIRTTGKARASMIVLNPVDWQDIRLMRTTDGVYIWGNPSEVGPMRVWGLPVVDTTDIAEGTGLVGDFVTYAKYFERLGIVVEITDSHSTDFAYGKQTLRARTRGAFRWSRPAAFCKVTGI